MQRLHLSESQHRPLPSPEGQVAVFSPIVHPATDLLLRAIAQFVHSCAVSAEPIRGDGLDATMPFQCLLDEGKGSLLVACLGDVALEDLAFLVDRTPEVMLLSVDVGYAALRVTNTSSRCQRQ